MEERGRVIGVRRVEKGDGWSERVKGIWDTHLILGMVVVVYNSGSESRERRVMEGEENKGERERERKKENKKINYGCC